MYKTWVKLETAYEAKVRGHDMRRDSPDRWIRWKVVIEIHVCGKKERGESMNGVRLYAAGLARVP